MQLTRWFGFCILTGLAVTPVPGQKLRSDAWTTCLQSGSKSSSLARRSQAQVMDATHGKRKDGQQDEASFDNYIFIRVEAQTSGLFARGNLVAEFGNLVFQCVCENGASKQADAMSACHGFESKIPAVGSHVPITGSLVTDLEHELLHNVAPPVSRIDASSINLRLGPPHWACMIGGGCELAQNWLTDSRPVLTPLGCFLAKTRITWIFGDRPKYCPR